MGFLKKPTQALHDGEASADRQKTPLFGMVAGAGCDTDSPGSLDWEEIDLNAGAFATA